MGKKRITKCIFLLICSLVLYTGAAAKNKKTSLSAVPGTFEDASHDGLDKVVALDKKLKPSDDEIIIYYVRPDKDYSGWALWMWAVPAGDGGASWNYTQNWKVKNGIGYMRFHLDGAGYRRSKNLYQTTVRLVLSYAGRQTGQRTAVTTVSGIRQFPVKLLFSQAIRIHMRPYRTALP